MLTTFRASIVCIFLALPGGNQNSYFKLPFLNELTKHTHTPVSLSCDRGAVSFPPLSTTE